MLEAPWRCTILCFHFVRKVCRNKLMRSFCLFVRSKWYEYSRFYQLWLFCWGENKHNGTALVLDPDYALCQLVHKLDWINEFDVSVGQLVQDINQLSSRSFIYSYSCNNNEKKASFIQLCVEAKGAKFSSWPLTFGSWDCERGLQA